MANCINCQFQGEVQDVWIFATYTGTPTGACCISTVCSITTEAGCAGTYQGDSTTCSPDPCEISATAGRVAQALF